MNRIALTNLSVEELVERFTAIALEQSEASRLDNIRKYNKLYDRMEEVRQELKSRNGDRRDALSGLMQHPNAQVRLKAAITVMALFPEAARRTLQDIVDKKEYPEAADAFGMLRALDDGSYRPS
jgi:CHASE3 domain sensor protein